MGLLASREMRCIFPFSQKVFPPSFVLLTLKLWKQLKTKLIIESRLFALVSGIFINKGDLNVFVLCLLGLTEWR